MGDLSTDLSKCVSFEIYPDIKEEDFDLLILFLESRKQSGGGDIQNIESLTFSSLENKKKFKIFYEDAEVPKRMIEKRFFKFKNYHLRSYEPFVNDYKSEKYDLETKKLIIKNIKIDVEEDDSIIRMYAEHLAPDNDIVHIQKSHLLNDTFYVVYKNDLNKESVLFRYNKKPSIRNQQITLFDSFSTNSLIVFSDDKTKQDFSQFINKTNTEFTSRENPPNFYMELKDKYVLFQFEDDEILNEMFDLIKLDTNSRYIGEKVFNYDLLDKSFDEVKNPCVVNQGRKKLVDACTQTDPIINSILKENIPNLTKKTAKNSKPSSLRSSFSESSSCISSNYSNVSNFEPFLTLDPNEYYTVALINSKQLFVNFQDDIKKIDKNLQLVYTNKNLFIRYNGKTVNNECKQKVLLALKTFFERRAAFKTIRIHENILKNRDSMQLLQSKLTELNKLSSAYYFRVTGDLIEGYGCKRTLSDKIFELNEFLKSFQSPKQLIKSENVVELNDVSDTCFNYEVKQDSLAYQALWNIRQVMFDFKNNIKPLNADLDVINNQKKIIITCVQRPDPDWPAKIKNHLSEFEKNQIKKSHIPIPDNLRGAKDVDTLKLHVKKYESNVNTIRVELINHVFQALGYTKAVDKFVREIQIKFKNLDGNSKSRIFNKLKMNINSTPKTLEYDILKGFNGKYYKELSDELDKLQASLAAYHIDENENGFKIFCNLDKTEQKNEQKVDEWVARVNQHRNEFCKKFEKQLVTLATGKKPPTKLDYNVGLASLKWLSPNEAEVIGIKSEVKKLVDQLVEKSKIPNENLKPSNGTSNGKKEETFLINDLQWFQTRILFEKQYFKYLADNFKDLNVMLDTQLTRICFTGAKNEIEKAKNLAFDILGKILGAEVECDRVTLGKMVQNEGMYNNMLKEKKICCVIDSKSHSDKFTIYATDLEDIEKCKLIFSKLKF